MKCIPINSMIGESLDCAVGLMCEWDGNKFSSNREINEDSFTYSPSTNWKHGGSIINICGLQMHVQPGVISAGNPNAECLVKFSKYNISEGPAMHGPTFLVAAMRAYLGYHSRNGFYFPSHVEQLYALRAAKNSVSAGTTKDIPLSDGDEYIGLIKNQLVRSRLFLTTAELHLRNGQSYLVDEEDKLLEKTGVWTK